MAAYMIILAEINDTEAFTAYALEAAALTQKFGGEYIIQRPSHSECLEGDWSDESKCVVSRWPNIDAAKAFWYSSEYANIKKLRVDCSTVHVRLVEMPEEIKEQ